MDRKVRDKILHEIKENGSLDKTYVVNLIKTYDEKPDTNKLIEQYYKSKADRMMSTFKDENGIRDCFSIKTASNKTKYIDLSKPNLLSVKEVEILDVRPSLNTLEAALAAFALVLRWLGINHHHLSTKL